jgi:type I restriction enzyme S subunit
MSLDIKFIPLSFINDKNEIIKNIKNSVLFSYLLNQYEETTLDFYLESTQYGFTASAQESGTHKLVRITDINSGSVNWDTVPFCNCDVEEKYLLKDNDILVARTGGTTGKSFLVFNPPNNSIFASYLIRLRLKADVDIEFINLFLNSYVFWSQIIEMKSGSAMPNVNAEKLKTLRLPKCDITTQKKIISVFKGLKKTVSHELFDKIDAIEDLYHNNDKLSLELTHQLDLVKQLRQAFLREAMQGKLVPQSTEDEPATVLLQKIKAEKAKLNKKEKPLPPIKAEEIPFEIPENWVWCRLGEVAEVLGGFAYNSTRYSKIETSNQVIRLGNVKTNTLVLNANPIFIDDDYAKETTKVLLQEGDILITMTGTRGKRDYLFTVCLKDEDFNKKRLFLNQRVGCFRFHYPLFIYFFNYVLKDDRLLENIFLSSTGAANQANIGIIELKEMPIPFPPLPEQQRIVAKLEELMALCDGLEVSIQAGQKQNEALLQEVLREALRGEESMIY